MTSRRCALLLALFTACQSSEGTSTDAATTTTSGQDDASSEPATASGATTTDDPGTTPTGDPATTRAPTTTATATTATTDEPAGDSSSGGEGAVCDLAGVYDCCCFSVEGDPGHGVLSIACPGAGTLCEAPQATCPEGQTDCDLADLTVTSPEGLDCVLDALAAGTPGAVSWGISSENGLNGSNHTLFIQEDGTLIASNYEYKELEYTYTAVDRRARQAAGFFSDCLAAATDGERFDCLRQATTGEATQTCVDGFSGSAGR